MNKKWEYKEKICFAEEKVNATLNDFGKDGWEVWDREITNRNNASGATYTKLYFKREIEEPEEKPKIPEEYNYEGVVDELVEVMEGPYRDDIKRAQLKDQ